MTENRAFNFTQAVIEALPAPASGHVYYFDTGQRNLCVAVSPKGHKSFFIWRKVKGRKVRFKLGRFPDISVKDARTDCGNYLNKIERGEDVEAARREAREELTLKAFFDVYLERHGKPHKKSWEYDKANFDNHLADPLGGRLLSGITQTMVTRLHSKISEERGPVIANRVLALLTVVYNKAQEWGHYSRSKDRPTRYVSKFKEKPRDRFLQGEELPRFFQALNQEPNETVRDYVTVSLFTGARKSNVLSMTWHEVDLNRKVWSIPETKNGEPLTLPLTDEVVDILRRRKKGTSSIFVFPGFGQKGHLLDPKKGWRRILRTANIQNLTLHDLRRTLGSWQTIAGASPFIVGRSLGHKDLKSTQVYARLNLDPVRQSISQATALMVKMGEAK